MRRVQESVSNPATSSHRLFLPHLHTVPKITQTLTQTHSEPASYTAITQPSHSQTHREHHMVTQPVSNTQVMRQSLVTIQIVKYNQQ
jgi:hypothetical protein